ncbi:MULTISPECIES: IS701 family transposase [Bradyrhizobium]|jgi:SRSO17 transposase|nr:MULTISPECIES: IS701 family transposase [Bradyrhizobium]MCS3716999.1 SRSO17 transposase [Bradyrhizobium elkanii]MDI2111069.1 IS701 family transposase [Bradyrhizobium sp. Mp64]NWL44271.1 IS701 family transposase [Bradyrhizobium elkanii]QOZ20508.1 IS701 family transposase [Bradyrhizobium sp. CCBAU 21365]WLA49536.1 IS701 family transposase [Bradyrhizobium elkanii]
MIRDLMIGGASVENTLALWASSLRDAKQRIRPLFTQERVAASAWQFLDGLLGNEPRKTGWMRAEAAGDPGPWRQQAILGRGRWDADALRDIVREYALEALGDEDAVLVIDETGFLKQGKASCGVARQYTGSAGKITNCQIGVFASYVSRHGHAFIDRALYLPKEWTDESARLKAAHVPTDVSFATKPKIARRMIARAIAAKVPFSFVAADSVYGTGEIETLLRKAGKGYVLGVASNHVFRSWGKQQPVAGTASAIAQSLPKKDWHRLSSGEGTKGPRWHDWTYLELADLDAGEYNDDLAGEWTRGLLIRRNIADGSLAFFSTWCPKGTSMQKLVSVEGHRWAIEDSFETAKNELGLDHNETRSWQGWHRHVSLVMLAFAMMAVIRHRANTGPLLKKTRQRPRP